MKIIIFLIILIIFSSPVFAGNDITITCSTDSCTKSHKLPFFNELNIVPGFINSQTLKVINHRTDSCNLLFKFNPILNSNNLSTVLTLSVVNGSDVWYSGQISDIFDEKTHQLGNIDGNQYKDYRWTISLKQSAGNEFQLQNNYFDISFNFTCDTENVTPVPTIASNENTSSDIDIRCRDATPFQIPQNLRTISGQNTVTLFWDEPTDNFTYYLIAYSNNPDAGKYGNPNIGGKGINSYTINNLSADTIYYFKIRTGNGCASGIFSDIVSAIPNGQVLVNQQPAIGFNSEILGVQDTVPDTTGSVEGVSCVNIFPFAFLLALMVNIIICPYHFITLSISILSLIFDYYLSKSTCQKFPYYYLGNIFSFLLPLIFSLKKKCEKQIKL
ncbi:MAG: fibronectin type III domain-containing protein [Candidatus Shapirobacteria bacterium]